MRDTSTAPPSRTLEDGRESVPPPTRLAGESAEAARPLVVAPSVIVGSCLVVLFFVWRFWRWHLTWFRPFLRDFASWLADPTVAGGPTASRPVFAAVVFGLAGFVGWVAARLILSGTRYAADRPVHVGLSITLGVAALGYGGMLGLVFGMLAPFPLFAALVVLGATLLILRRRQSSRTAGQDRQRLVDLTATRLRDRPIAIATAALVALMFTWMLVHAVLSPVQEWDATIYHAESARLWFEQRPDPPLIYGPSVGIELSVNYPPLFPAAGAAIYTMIGRFDDLYLRLLPPILFLSIALMTFGFARRRFDENAAWYSVLLLCGTPLLVMYGVWQTGYILITALVLATFVLAEEAAESGGLRGWAIAGVLAGLAVLGHLYGLVALPVGVAALLLVRRGQRLRSLALFGGIAIAIASPWLLRNLILLSDPFWPFASPPFPGKGLVEPFWGAAQEEIRSNALAQLGVTPGVSARLQALKTGLFDSALLPVGMYAALAFAAVRGRSERVVAVLGLGLACVLLVLVAPGWYWLRGILPALPLAALLTGRAAGLLVDAARAAGQQTMRFAGALAWVLVTVTAWAAIAGGALFGLALSVAGPNQAEWTIQMSSEDDLMRGVRTLGSTPDTLWNVFSGDALLWRYMNQVIPEDARVATLENRAYYLDDADDLFYLDGLEAEPLARLRSAQAIERFLSGQGVRYVVLPNRMVSGPGRFPIVDVLPLFDLLGSERFPTVAAFPVQGFEIPSVVYGVGRIRVPPVIGVFPGAGQPEPSLSGGTVTLQPGATDPRISVPLSPDHDVALRFRYDRSGRGSFQINLFDPERGWWHYRFFARDRRGGRGWETVTLPLPGGAPYAQLGVNVSGDPLRIRGLEVVPPSTSPAREGSTS